MKTTITILRVGEPAVEEAHELPERIGLDKIYALVQPHLNGGQLERVLVFWEGQYRDMFVDDCGALKGLERNEAATEIYRNNVLVHAPKTVVDVEDMPAIYGPAVLFDRRVWF